MQRSEKEAAIMRRVVLVGVGVLVTLAGVIFTLQGVGVLGGSVMSGVTFWAVAGPVIALAGLALAAIGLRGGLASQARRLCSRPPTPIRDRRFTWPFPGDGVPVGASGRAAGRRVSGARAPPGTRAVASSCPPDHPASGSGRFRPEREALVTAVLDHLAIGTPTLTDGWELFGGVLGGTWVYGGDSPGFWWGQLEFAAGPKIELMTPTGGPDAAFLERFLATRGASPHHFNFIVTDIEATMARIRALGIEPVQVNLSNPNWKEAFLHPRSAHGIVIQVAQQASSPRVAPPRELPEPGRPALFDLIEHRVGDLDGATRLFREALDGRLEAGADDTAELTWPGGKRIRLVREDGLPLGGSLHHIRFTRADGAFSTHDKERAGLLAKRLGLTVELASP